MSDPVYQRELHEKSLQTTADLRRFPAGCILEHDNRCGVFKDGFCTCDPNVVAMNKNGETHYLHFLNPNYKVK